MSLSTRAAILLVGTSLVSLGASAAPVQTPGWYFGTPLQAADVFRPWLGQGQALRKQTQHLAHETVAIAALLGVRQGLLPGHGVGRVS
jgi:hypothetical protein